MTHTLTGVIHGQVITLDQPIAIADGCKVEIVIRETKQPTRVHTWGGALADDWSDEDDRILAEIAKSRALATPRSIEE